MRTFNAISSWFLWVLALVLWLMFLFIRVVNTIPPVTSTAEHAASYTRVFWLSLFMLTALAALSYVALHYFWHRSGRSPGFGFWIVSVLFYLCAIFIPAGGFAPYFGVGDRSLLQWASLAFAGVLLILGFPHLPSDPTNAPKSLSTGS